MIFETRMPSNTMMRTQAYVSNRSERRSVESEQTTGEKSTRGLIAFPRGGGGGVKNPPRSALADKPYCMCTNKCTNTNAQTNFVVVNAHRNASQHQRAQSRAKKRFTRRSGSPHGVSSTCGGIVSTLICTEC